MFSPMLPHFFTSSFAQCSHPILHLAERNTRSVPSLCLEAFRPHLGLPLKTLYDRLDYVTRCSLRLGSR